jgi:hypothetical protein
MSRKYPDALSLSRTVLRAVVVLNVTAGAFISGLLIASLVAEGFVMKGLGAAGNPPMMIGMRIIMVAGIASVALAHLILKKLIAMVDTVRAGDPFVAENADRLQSIAWLVLATELLYLAVGVIARVVSTEARPLDINWSFSITPWLAVLLLFVLARVFDHGARMRADLEGTV